MPKRKSETALAQNGASQLRRYRLILPALGLLVALGCGGDDAEDTSDGGAVQADAGTHAQDASTGGPTGEDLGPATSSFDAGSDGKRNVVAKGGLCERLSFLQCAAEQACCSSVARTFDACMTAQRDSCRNQVYLDDASHVEVAGFDSDAARAAFERFEQLALRCDPQITAWALETNPGLRGIFAGTLGVKDSCLPPADVLLRGDQGVAAGYALACRNPESTACLPATFASWTCEPRGGVGARCFTDANCAGETFCDNPSPGPSSIGSNTTCKARKPLGSACASFSQCETLACVAGQCAPKTADATYCLGR